MYLEDYGVARAGPKVTPEDLVDSARTQSYFTWVKKDYE
jgi:hypothetical protein